MQALYEIICTWGKNTASGVRIILWWNHTSCYYSVYNTDNIHIYSSMRHVYHKVAITASTHHCNGRAPKRSFASNRWRCANTRADTCT